MAERTREVKQTVKPAAYTRTVQQVKKRCPVCGREFWGARLRTYCSHACQLRANYQHHIGEYRKARRERYHAGKEKR